MHGYPYTQPSLVVCSGMLLIVHYSLRLASSGAPVNYKAYCLDMSIEPVTWVEVVKLENDALFMGHDVRSPAFSCMSPGRWGGRINYLYYAHYNQPWVLHGMGDDAEAVWDDSTDPDLVHSRGLCLKLQPF
ncbi:unnamed protein product [Miscanthus lutarioriparius]|uniref:Uncharacterized protein n=1 Tax=Miscanthus lutarioriparius TaxID=422564 RepID=A0A811NE76_9POAL|nr:unnamed protein product [Miscanthus lutarioriparius]